MKKGVIGLFLALILTCVGCQDTDNSIYNTDKKEDYTSIDLLDDAVFEVPTDLVSDAKACLSYDENMMIDKAYVLRNAAQQEFCLFDMKEYVFYGCRAKGNITNVADSIALFSQSSKIKLEETEDTGYQAYMSDDSAVKKIIITNLQAQALLTEDLFGDFYGYATILQKERECYLYFVGMNGSEKKIIEDAEEDMIYCMRSLALGEEK